LPIEPEGSIQGNSEIGFGIRGTGQVIVQVAALRHLRKELLQLGFCAANLFKRRWLGLTSYQESR
jgi:hypothetical protein